ncbi:MAG: capsid cement protein [Polyangiales bacterium]
MPIEVSEGAAHASGTNVNAAYTIPEARVCGYGVSSTASNPVDRVSVTGVARIKGVTTRPIAPGKTHNVCVGGVREVDTDGSGPVARGDRLTVNATPGPVEGCVYSLATAPLPPGTTAHLVGIAEDPAPAAVTRIRVRLAIGATLTRAS